MIEIKVTGNSASDILSQMKSLIGDFAGGSSTPAPDAQPEVKPTKSAKQKETAAPAQPEAPAPVAPSPAAEKTIEDLRAAVAGAIKRNKPAVIELLLEYNVDVSKGQKAGDILKPSQFAEVIAKADAITA